MIQSSLYKRILNIMTDAPPGGLFPAEINELLGEDSCTIRIVSNNLYALRKYHHVMKTGKKEKKGYRWCVSTRSSESVAHNVSLENQQFYEFIAILDRVNKNA